MHAYNKETDLVSGGTPFRKRKKKSEREKKYFAKNIFTALDKFFFFFFSEQLISRKIPDPRLALKQLTPDDPTFSEPCPKFPEGFWGLFPGFSCTFCVPNKTAKYFSLPSQVLTFLLPVLLQQSLSLFSFFLSFFFFLLYFSVPADSFALLLKPPQLSVLVFYNWEIEW